MDTAKQKENKPFVPLNDHTHMFERRSHVTRPDAPAVHAHVWRDESAHQCHVEFNGVDILTLSWQEGSSINIRGVSDGDFQTIPFIQQFMAWSDINVKVRAYWKAPVEMWNMRPRRAQGSQAILGQEGYPLLYGVNGLYLPDWDLLMDFEGPDFTWTDSRIREENGFFTASMDLIVGVVPFIVQLRPHYYSEHLGYRYYEPWKRRPNPEPVCGWCSWEAYHSDISQEALETDANVLQELKPYGLHYMQIDDGYQPEAIPVTGKDMAWSWLHTNEKFPNGHEGIVQAISDAGFNPAIWTGAYANNEEGAVQLGSFLKDENGKLLNGDWIRYILDCEPQTLTSQIVQEYKRLKEKGYSYFKVDSIRHLLYDGLQEAVRRGLMEPEEARKRHHAYMQAIREGIGKDSYLLSCWGVLSTCIGVCDGMRVATDSNPQWSSFSMQLRETARWFFAQRVLFTVDPDIVCVRSELSWARMMLSLVSLTGSVFLISDKPQQYDEKRLSLIKRTMPALSVHTAETGPVDYCSPSCPPVPRSVPLDHGAAYMAQIEDTDKTPFSSLWAIHFDYGGRIWTVVQRAAVVPLDRAEINLEDLALDPSKEYAVLDFWDQKTDIVQYGVLPMHKLALGDTQVVALTEIAPKGITLCGSNRHVSMDAVSVSSCGMQNGQFFMKLCGAEGWKITYTLYITEGKAAVVSAQRCDVSLRQEGCWLTLETTLHSDQAEVVLHC